MYKNFTYGEIYPEGWLLRQLKIQADGLAGNLDKMWPDVRDSAWIGGDKEGWERVPYWLDGFVPLAFLLRDGDMISRAEKYLNAIMDGQKPDGWICPCADDKRGEYDVWALFLICKVLAEYGIYAGNGRALECTEKALKNLYSRMLEGSTKLRQWGKFRWFEALIPLKIVKETFGGEWEDGLAALLKEQGADYAGYTDEWKTPVFRWRIFTHIVNLSMMLKTEAEYSAFTHGEYTDEAQRLYDILYRYNGTAVGLINGDECLAGVSPVAGTELCAVVELMYSCERLFALTGEPKWADLLERIAFNALPAATTEDMWAHQYDQQANQIGCVHLPGKSPWMTNGSESNMFGLEPEFGCCTANFGQGWPKLAQNIFLRSEKGVVAALPLACGLKTQINGVAVGIEAEGDYPFSGKVTYRITAAKPVNFEFSARIPAGAKAFANGRPVRGGTAVFDREWSGTETVTLEYKFAPRLSPRPKKMYFAEYGPLVFCLPVKAEWKTCEFVRDGVERKLPYADYELAPESDWAFGFASGEIKMRFGKSGEIPFSESAPPLTMEISLAPVEWGFLRGYTTVADRWPKHRKALGKAKKYTFIPYGCTMLRLTEMPKIIK
ncbi:MAG: glycoside hydrolase family 127 protein [Clostridia bacterium]|nr:glycoside hydrolase family 127 protein [Clostridia bacterium]